MIEPRADAYGKEADSSALADYLELLALAGAEFARAELADLISDNNWRIRSRELFHTPSAPMAEGEDDEEPEEDRVGADLLPDPGVEAAIRVFDTLAERASELGDLYPFRIDDPRLVAIDPIEEQHVPYLSLLAITVAHAYNVVGGQRAEDAFEDLVARVMTARGLATVDMAAVAREAGDFRAAVRLAGERVFVVPAPEEVISRENANEEGVDTVSHLSWGDTRPGHWLYIGQATCGMSETWERKLGEPKPTQWGRLLGSFIQPAAYLAVPHHVEALHLQHLCSGAGRLVLDRLRLCRFVDGLSDDHLQLVDAVRGEGVWQPNRE